MTDERDDLRFDEREQALLAAQDNNARLDTWARLIGALLLGHNGVPKPAIDEIVEEALGNWRNFNQAVTNPCSFIARRISTKGKAYLALRDIEPAADPEQAVPKLRNIARMQAGFDLLTGKARKALQILFEDENASYLDVAQELGVTPRYAEYLVNKALDQLRWWISQTWPQK